MENAGNGDVVTVETIRGLTWGLDMSTDDVTPEEIERFREIDLMVAGYRQHGLEFMLHNHPSALKRYRAWADTLRIREPGETQNFVVSNALEILVFYALSGNEEGLYYCLSRHGPRAHARTDARGHGTVLPLDGAARDADDGPSGEDGATVGGALGAGPRRLARGMGCRPGRVQIRRRLLERGGLEGRRREDRGLV